MMKVRYIVLLWVVSLVCALWVYGWCVSAFGGWPRELAFLESVAKLGVVGVFVGFAAAAVCAFYGKIWSRIFVAPFICFHGIILWEIVLKIVSSMFT